MSSRFPSSTLHQRDSRNDLFKGYTGGAGSSSRTATASPSRLNPSSSGGSYGGGGGYNAAPSQSSYGLGGSHTTTPSYGGHNNFRPATPNARGQYSDAVLNELESQNDAQVDGILGKVKILKDMTMAIGDEIRDSSALADKMNDGFDRTRLRLRGTMNRMMVMAERTGVGWRVWLGFFAAVVVVFVYVWLF